MGNSTSTQDSPLLPGRDFPPEVWLSIIPFVAVAAEPRTITLQTLTYGQVMIQRSPLPAALQINYNIRTVTLLHYEMAFNAIDGHGVYFDFERDILSVGNVREYWIDTYQVLHPELSRIRHLIATTLTRTRISGFQHIAHNFDFSSLLEFTGLRTLRLPRDNVMLNEMDTRAYDIIGRRQLAHWSRRNMPADSPVPTLTFFSVPRPTSHPSSRYDYSEYDDDSSYSRTMRLNHLMGDFGGGLGGGLGSDF